MSREVEQVSVYKSSKKCKLSYALIAVLIIVFIAAAVFCYQLSIHIDEISRYESKLLATRIINTAVENSLDSIDVNELISEKFDSSGKLQALSLDHIKTNRINSTISAAVTDMLKKYEDEGFKVPIGTLSGITFLNGRGFDLDLRLHQLGAVSTQMHSEFVSCGVNQSKYRVYIEIKVELSAVLPIKTTDVSVDYEYLIGEKVIVGEVPNSYFSL